MGVAAAGQASNDVRHQSKATRLVTSSAGIECPFNKLQEGKEEGVRKRGGRQRKREKEEAGESYQVSERESDSQSVPQPGDTL